MNSSATPMTETQTAVDKARFKKRIVEARIGDVAAQYDVAIMYANGVGTKKELGEAFEWFKAAAAKGHPGAQYLLGVAYAQGVGTEKDEFLAVRWFFKAADQGNEKALLKLAKRIALNHEGLAFLCSLKAAELGAAEGKYVVGQCYAKGVAVQKNEKKAQGWYEQAARLGVPAAQFALASILNHSSESTPDKEAALRWYRAAAAQGHPGAQIALARLDDVGIGRGKSIRRRTRKVGIEERRNVDERWIHYAENGDAEDRYNLGLMYELGITVDQNPSQAGLWYQKAAEHQHREAQIALAKLCESAEMADDAELAFPWWKMAAEQGSAEAQFAIGKRYATGDGVQPDPLQSMWWHMRAAEQGHPEALMAVHARLTPDVTTGTQDVAHACIVRAAEQGHAQAQFEMGKKLLDTTDAEGAHDWFHRAAMQGNVDAQCALGAWYAEGRGGQVDFMRALEWYLEAAQQDHLRAQWLLGGLYATGSEDHPSDAKRATMWCTKAANAGYAPAQATLGTLFAQAKKVDRAVSWWAKAAVQGDAEAQFNLANAYRTGVGVKADIRTAFLLLSKAAAAGLPAAQSRLGLAYAKGEGAAIDNIEATKWFLIAQQGGDKSAAANCEHARALLSPVQLAEAHWRVSEWKSSAAK